MASNDEVRQARRGRQAEAEDAGQVMAAKQNRKDKINEMISRQKQSVVQDGQRQAYAQGRMDQGVGQQTGMGIGQEVMSKIEQDQMMQQDQLRQQDMAQAANDYTRAVIEGRMNLEQVPDELFPTVEQNIFEMQNQDGQEQAMTPTNEIQALPAIKANPTLSDMTRNQVAQMFAAQEQMQQQQQQQMQQQQMQEQMQQQMG